MFTYFKNVFLLLTTVAVNVRCQYLLEEYAPTYGNYEPIKYTLPVEIPVSGDSYHKLQRRNADLSKREENIRLEQIISDDTQDTLLYNRVRRGGVYGEKTERKVPEINNEPKNQRTRYASRSSTSRQDPDASKLPTTTNSTRSRNLSNRRRNEPPPAGNQKRIVKKESYAESYFTQPTEIKNIEYIPNFNLNPLNVENIQFQTNGQQFLQHLSSIQPQQFYQSFPSSTPKPYNEQQTTNNEREKLIINVPDEPQDYIPEKPKQIEQTFTYIHSQPHTQTKLDNIQRFISPTESPRIQNYQPPAYHGPQQAQIKPQYETVENEQYQPEYASKGNSNKDSGTVVQDGEIKYINYGYRQPSGFQQYNTQPNYATNQQQFGQNYFNTNNNYPQITETQIKPDDKLNSQNHYPAILVHINGKTGLPFYPTSKNIFSVPHDAEFNYEGIPLIDFNKKDKPEPQETNTNEDFRKEVYKSHYGYDGNEENEEEPPSAQRRLYTGLTFHASSRNLYDGKTPSLRNPPPKLGDVIWQAGDPITDPQEILVRQLNETCAYIQFNETTPGNEDGLKPNIWQAGDYSAQREEEELIRSVNITCENYTTDVLANFTSGYTIIDYCSQCLNKYTDYEYDYNNQNQENVQSVDQNYNLYYQPSQDQTQYQYYNDGGNIDPRLENGEIAGFYKRKRLAPNQDNNSKKQ